METQKICRKCWNAIQRNGVWYCRVKDGYTPPVETCPEFDAVENHATRYNATVREFLENGVVRLWGPR